MSIRTPSPSIFRPKRAIDQSVLEENKKLVEDINRRKLLRGAVSLGALSLLTGCDVTDKDAVQSVLTAVSSFNDKVQALLFRPNHLALLWQIFSSAGFPNRFLRDSWEVGSWRADPWTWTGKRISIAGLRRSLLRYGTSRGRGCVQPILRG